MPVAHKGESVYQQEFKWKNRRERDLREYGQTAGMPTDLKQCTMDPPIQRKKRVESAPRSTVKISAAASENGSVVGGEPYMILGQQEKFAHNVTYKPAKSTSQPKAAGLISEVASTPMAPREPAPAPRVQYDTGAPHRHRERTNGKIVPDKSEMNGKHEAQPQVSNHTDIETPRQCLAQLPKTISKADITEIKSLANPPHMVKITMEAVCLLLGVAPERRLNKPDGAVTHDYWTSAKKLLASPDVLERLKDFDVGNVPDSVMNKLRSKYLSDPEFRPEVLAKISMACKGLCAWVLAVDKYYRKKHGRRSNKSKSQRSKSVPPENKMAPSVTSRESDTSRSERQREYLNSPTYNYRRKYPMYVSGGHESLDKVASDRELFEPVLAQAKRAMRESLSLGDLQEVRSLANPPATVIMVMASVCELLGVNPIAKKQALSWDVDKDYWKPAKRMLADSKALFNKLQNIDVTSIPDSVMSRLRTQYLNKPEYSFEQVAPASKAAAGVCRYMCALDRYERLKRQEFYYPPPAPKVKYDVGAPKPKQSKSAPKPSQSSAPQAKDSKTKTDATQTKNGQVRETGPEARRQQRKGQMNEFSQTNLDKGVADSRPEAPEYYAMAYRAGVPPPRNTKPKRQSEYSMQFTWKEGVASSPLLAAEQIVYKSNPSAPPFKRATMNKHSEYETQFQAWSNARKSTPNLVKELKHDKIERASPEKLRSKSVENLHMDRMPAAGLEALSSPDDKRFVQETMNPQKLFPPHGKRRRESSLSDGVSAISLKSVYSPDKQLLQPPKPKHKPCVLKSLLYYNFTDGNPHSEYQSNFKKPQKFAYDHGAWKGADPPQIVQRAEPDSARSMDSAISDTPSATWYNEVMELRQKANEYKRRAHGTHFSHEHVGQLYAQQAQLWDEMSVNSGVGGEEQAARAGVVSALNLEVPRSRGSSVRSSARSSRKDAWSNATTPVPSGMTTPASERTLTPEGRDDVTEMDDDVTTVRDDVTDMIDDVDSEMWGAPAPKKKQSKSRDHEKRSSHENKPRQKESKSRQSASNSRIDETKGRIPTPKLRTVKGNQSVPRHHLDRTTPSSGGALLVSPPPRRRSAFDQESVRSAGTYTAYGARDALAMTSAPIAGQTQVVACGMPTRDSHVLVDDDVRSDHTLPTNYVQNPANPDPVHKLRTIREEASDTYKATLPVGAQVTIDDIPRARPRDDDERSLSTMSIASSCSLASQTLEKARLRRDQFWGDNKSKNVK